jgi:hypothetical protein
MVFLFAALGAGIACGLRAHGAAIIGTILFVSLATFFTYVEFGQRRHFDGILRINLPKQMADELGTLIRNEASRFALISMRDVAQGSRTEFVYQLELKDASRRPDLLSAAMALQGATDVSLLIQDNAISL